MAASESSLLVVVGSGGCYTARLPAAAGGGGGVGIGVGVGVVGTRQHSI